MGNPLAMMSHPQETDVLGDIEQWADTYLDSGLHLEDWDQRIQIQEAHFSTYLQTPLGYMPPAAAPRSPEEGA